MFVHRRYPRSLTLACATAALAVAPGAALAQPAVDAPQSQPGTGPVFVEPDAAPIVREIRTNGDTTLAVILAGSALLIAAGGAGLAGRDHVRIRHIV
jgi:hypothetical protein